MFFMNFMTSIMFQSMTETNSSFICEFMDFKFLAQKTPSVSILEYFYISIVLL